MPDASEPHERADDQPPVIACRAAPCGLRGSEGSSAFETVSALLAAMQVIVGLLTYQAYKCESERAGDVTSRAPSVPRVAMERSSEPRWTISSLSRRESSATNRSVRARARRLSHSDGWSSFGHCDRM